MQNAFGLAHEELGPPRVVVHDQDSAGKRLQLSDGRARISLLGKGNAVIGWVYFFRHR